MARKKQDTSTVVAVVTANKFRDALLHCQRVALDPKKDNSRPFMCSLHVQGCEDDQTVRVEATDGFRLFSRAFTAAMVTDFNAFISSTSIAEIRSTLAGVTGDLTLRLDVRDGGYRVLFIEHGETRMLASWGKDLSWPNAAQLDPRRQYGATWIHRMPNRITALRAELIDACNKAVKLKSASIWLKSEFGRVSIAWHDRNEQGGFSGVELRATGEDDEHSPIQCFDPRYLRDALRTGEQGDSITIYCPVKIASRYGSSYSYIVGETVLMPRLDKDNPFSDMEQKGA